MRMEGGMDQIVDMLIALGREGLAIARLLMHGARRRTMALMGATDRG